MANPEHLSKLKEGVKNWNEWQLTRRKDVVRLSGANLSGADLRKLDLSGADLSGADLRGADLTDADLSDANLALARLRQVNFKYADLSRADLSRATLPTATFLLANAVQANFNSAILSGANFNRTNLNSANLVQANLSSASFRHTSFRGANLARATMKGTIFANTDLSEAKDLALCIHEGPSTIGIDTFFASEGAIPEVFLRGCGVPEQFITYARSLLTEPIQFYSCFISYSSHDQVFAERLHADLRAKDLRCWFAPEDLKIGDRFQESIEESIRLFDKVMIVLSEDSMKSRWVEREVNAAREREDRENRAVLFPIRIDDAVMKAPQPWAADIWRSRHIGDFSQWKNHDAYSKGFERLLRDLKADETKAQKA